VRSHAKASSAISSRRGGAIARCAALSLLFLVSLMAFAATGAAAKPQVTEHYASFGPDGTESSDFERINGVAVDQQTGVVYVLDGEAGTLSKFDEDGTPLPFTGTAPYIEDGVITGLASNTKVVLGRWQVAVDSSSHIIYVTEETSIRAFQADGDEALFSAGPGEGTSEIPGFVKTTGVAVDVNGAIYAADETANTVSIYASSGALLTTFATGAPEGDFGSRPGNLAVASNGVLYVDRPGNINHEGVRKYTPSVFPAGPGSTYTDDGYLEYESGRFSVGVGVDPANGDVFILESSFGDTRIKKFDKAGNFLRFFGGPEEEEERLGGQAQGIAILGGGEEFQFYVGDTDLNGEDPYSKVAIYGEEITEGPPTIKSTTVDDVTANTAVLKGKVNPNTAATTYHFEYGTEDCAVSVCTSVPLGGGQIAAGHNPVSISEALFGLTPGTTYHYRIVAENSFSVEPTEGPDRTFTTQVSGLGFTLADSRAWEMVTPSDKFGARLYGAYDGSIQAAADGNGFAYITSSSIEADPPSSRSFEQVSAIARRGPEGWQSTDITPPHESVAGWPIGPGPEYKLFSADLSKAVFDPRSTTLFSPEASERTPYIRENTEPATYTPLVTGKEGFANVPPGTEFGGDPDRATGPVSFAGATADFNHVVVHSNVPLAAGAAAATLYEWTGGELHPVSALPASEGGAIVSASMIGTSPSSPTSARVVRNAISENGSRVFWTQWITSNNGHLYMRDTVAEETVRLDTLHGGSGSGNVEPVYQGANADGSVVFFTDTQQLSADASPEGADLYRCELPLGGVPSECAALTDISAPAEGSGESAEVQGIVSALGANATTLYFAAKGVLDSTPNAQGDTATPKQPNLYLWQEGEGTRFIATLSKNDSYDWGEEARLGERNLSVAASPGGRYFAFMSERSLTGEDNLDVPSGRPLEQAFRYDAATEELICVSCNPSGASPHGKRLQHDPMTNAAPLIDPLNLWDDRFLAASMPQGPITDETAETSFYRPRAVLDSGRVFFNAFDALVPADSNGNWDVYQYEPIGVGDCTASSGSAAISRSGPGCVALVSSGTAEGESAFFDASESGDDVFFTTLAKLSVLDTDRVRDIYDARVNGVVAKLTPRTECQGEACLPVPTPPNDATPTSASFKGAGNVTSERCPASKRKVIRAGSSRCVAKKHKKKRSHKAKRAASNRRAGR
jgi:hypothetical protein